MASRCGAVVGAVLGAVASWAAAGSRSSPNRKVKTQTGRRVTSHNDGLPACTLSVLQSGPSFSAGASGSEMRHLSRAVWTRGSPGWYGRQNIRFDPHALLTGNKHSS